MCGIVGTVSTRPQSSQEALLASRLLRHRGPDAGGVQVLPVHWGSVAVGMTRLSIVDRKPLIVPLRSGRVTVACNGEIYNWKEIRKNLSGDLPWETECDTEVIARGWARWGPSVLDHLNGMFALVLVDQTEGTVMLARDRAGEKPLYWCLSNGDLHFSSEIKALPVVLEEVPCPHADIFEFDCLDHTPFQGVRRLGPGQRIVLRGRSDLECPRVETWWRLPQLDPKSGDRTEELQSLLADAIRIRVPEEVPAAVLLSGGLDSSIIQAVAGLERLYTVTFPSDGQDVMPEARLASLGHAEPVPVTFGYGDLLGVLEEVAWHLDTPATWTSVCQWHLAKACSEAGVVVVLSGEGADELFYGYSRYKTLWWLDMMREDPALDRYGSTIHTLLGVDGSGLLARLLNRGGDEVLARGIVEEFGTEYSLVERMARVEWHTTLQCLLRMADRMFSAFSIENRSPFLDHRVIEFAQSLPSTYKINSRATKDILREVAVNLGVAPEIVWERNKRGMTLPWPKWRRACPSGPRGAWDRSEFVQAMKSAWRRAFSLPEP